jgi:TolB protein
MDVTAASLAPLLALALAGCARSGPLDLEERAELPGTLVFVSEATGEPLPERIRLDGTARRTLTGTCAAIPYGASPDGRLLAAVTQPGDESDDLLLIDLAGAKPPRRLASSPALDWYPRFSPDGARLLFESNRASFRDLFVVGTDGGEPRRLTEHPAGSFDGAWSPDGQRLAFVSSRNGSLDLYVMRVDGSDVRRLTRHPGDVMKPAWSSDGARIAFLSGRDGRDDLFAIAPDGTGLVNLTAPVTRPDPAARRAGQEIEGFEWHPRAPLLVAVLRGPRTGGRLLLVTLDQAPELLTHGPASDSTPSWSPDARWLAFTRSEIADQPTGASPREPQPSVWIVRADGKRATRVVEPPSWRPRWIAAR